ncbi:MAG: sugar phosphate nucleotidyltransferase, partial [Methanobacteriota archaeon]
RGAGRPKAAFLALNGDVLSDLAIPRLVAAHARAGGLATIALTKVRDPSAFGVVARDGTRVERFVEKPARGTEPSRLVNAGIYVLEPEVLDLVPRGGPSSVERDVFPVLAEKSELHGIELPGRWMDCGNVETYREANRRIAAGRVLRARGVRARGARFSGWACLGEGCTVGGDARIARSVLAARATVGPGARVADSVLGPDADVGEGAVLSRVVAGEGARIPAGTRLSDVAVDGEGVR